MSQIIPSQEKIKTLKDLLEKAKPSIKSILPSHLTVERLFNIAVQSVSRNPVLLQCTPVSILYCVVLGAQLGLEVGGPLGHAYLVPFKNNKTGNYEATFIVGYRGLIKLARNSGEVKKVEAHIVREKDSFKFSWGTSQIVDHSPCLDGEPGAIKCAYVKITYQDDSEQYDLMTRSELDKIRERSRAKDSGPWISDPEEMMKKTVARRGLKYSPMDHQMAKALELDNRLEEGSGIGDLIEGELSLPGELQQEPSKTSTEKLKEDLKKKEESVKTPDMTKFMEAMNKIELEIGPDDFSVILGQYGFERSEHIIEREKQDIVYKHLQEWLKERNKGKKP